MDRRNTLKLYSVPGGNYSRYFPSPHFFLLQPSHTSPPTLNMSWLAGQKDEEDEYDNLGVDWVLQYEFGEIGK